MLHSVEVDLGSGRILTLESGKMAKQANGAVISPFRANRWSW